MYVCIVTENVENEAINTRVEDISNGEGKNRSQLMHFTSYVCIVTENIENGATNSRVEGTSNREGIRTRCA